MTKPSPLPLVRPITLDDLESYELFAKSANLSMTSMPQNRELLLRNLHESLDSFANPRHASSKVGRYLFILQDPTTKKAIGISCLHTSPHQEVPLYALYHDTIENDCPSLHFREHLRVLKPRTTPQGHSRLESLFILPQYRQGGLGKLLSLARLMFVATFPERFDPILRAELRGVFEESGYCPFWEAVGRHFFHMDFAKADKMRAIDEHFIADLLPKHLLYVTLLPKEAQHVIGKVYKDTAPALHFLQNEGFAYNHFVDIFDAGPHVICHTKNLRTTKHSFLAPLTEVMKELQAPPHLVVKANAAEEFCACITPLATTDSGALILPANAAKTLNVEIGTTLRYLPLSSHTSTSSKASHEQHPHLH